MDETSTAISTPPRILDDYSFRMYYPRSATTGRHHHAKLNIKDVNRIICHASPAEIAKIRDDRAARKALNFRKRLPAGHPDRIES